MSEFVGYEINIMVQGTSEAMEPLERVFDYGGAAPWSDGTLAHVVADLLRALVHEYISVDTLAGQRIRVYNVNLESVRYDPYHEQVGGAGWIDLGEASKWAVREALASD